ncbi:ABC transporter permease subunit [Paenibacillus sp. PL2-23]|uniref:ABC transporter permease n=1 Tax=Paenibacillus sp. PL2-23 TaxID=2100729 RepID=UPI0030FA80FD
MPQGEAKLKARKSILLMVLCAAAVIPCIPILLWSFSQQWRYPELLPVWSLRAWQSIFSPHSQVLPAAWNSLGLAIATSLLSQAAAYPAARALGLYVKAWSKPLRLLMIGPLLIPGISIAIGVHMLFLRIGLADLWIGVVLAHLITAIPYAIYLLYGFYATYDSGYETQLRLLGASRWQTFLMAELPLLRPALSLSVLFSFLISWSQYLFTVFIGGGHLVTLPMLLFSTVSSGDYALTSALSLLLVAPALVIVILTALSVNRDRYHGKEAKRVTPVI